MKWRRIVSILCSLSLVAGMVPSALAADRAATDGDTANGSSLSDHVVKNTVTPSGIVLNLFDYWVTDNRTDADNSTGADYSDKGINKDHYLKFSSSGLGDQANSINKWTGNSTPRSGIVAPQLSGGYPELTAGKFYDGNRNTTKKQSLDYLFDKSAQTGKEPFWNVQGLLQVDDDGYYYYNADSKKLWDANHKGYRTANYAVFDESKNSFKLYDIWGVQASGGAANKPQGQFFPFTDASKVFTVSETGGLSSSIESHDPALNHYFGMTMTTRFVQRYKGMTSKDDSTAKHMTFEFAGDDDVWLFIDGVLVSDLGGIHDQATTSIDFYNGEITVNGKPAGTLKEKMSKYYPDEGTWRGDTFADDTYHTMKLFYLERGGTDSNLAMKFNLAHVPETDGIKVDQYGVALPGVDFTLYAAKPAEGSEGSETGYVVDTSKGVKQDGVLARGQTGADGRFVLNDGEDATISLNELHQQGIEHLLLREDGDRTGYQHMRDIYLHLEDYGADLLLLNDINHQWQTGSYAQPKETVYANPNIVLRDAEGQPIPGSGKDISTSGLMFAVIMRRLDGVGVHSPAATDHWGIVSGNALDGWNITPAASNGYIPAVLDMIHNSSNASQNYFVFTPCSNGSYMTELDNCPGDMRNYYFWLKEKDEANLKDAAYSIAYYYTEEKSLDKATPENTHEVYSKEFERQFTATLYIPNVKNYLRVQKTDTEGNPVNGATFSLYKKNDVTVTTDETTGAVSYEIKSGASPYDTAKTRGYSTFAGIANFPQKSTGLDAGEYYLIETAAPAGYLLNPTPIHVVVDQRGVLADAGSPHDGVSVSVSEGSLVSTMRQFADPDGIDYTLTDVKATQLIGTYNEETHQVDFTDAPNSVSHMTVGPEIRDLVTYINTDPESSEPWTTESGWIWFRMEQDYDGYSMQAAKAQGQVYKENLGETDITPLFAAMTTVTVRDQPVGSLTISKTVETAEGSDEQAPGQSFQFRVTLKSENTALPSALSKLAENSAWGSTTLSNNGMGFEGTLTLKNGDSVTISDLPIGTTCKVEELRDGLSAEKWKTYVKYGTEKAATHEFSGTIENAGDELKADFINVYGTHIVYQPAVVEKAILVTKTYTSDSDPYNGDVTFTVTSNGNAPRPEREEVSVSSGATASFGSITFEAAGEYTYTVKEVNGRVPGMTYDSSEYTVTFTVAEDKTTGNLKVDQVSYAKAGAETTEQQPAEEVPVETPAGDPVENPTPENPPENPELKPDQSENPPQNPEQNPAENPAETPEQDPDNQPQQDPEPRVDENPMNQLAGESLQADNASGESSVYDAVTGFTFVNRYKKPAEQFSITVGDALRVKKTYANNAPFAGGVTFEITPQQGAPAPEHTQVTVTGAGDASFGSIPFTEEGTFQYTVREIPGTVDGMTYDKTVYTVIITVKIEDDVPHADVQYLIGDVPYCDYGTNGGIVFRNTYTGSEVVPTTGTLRIFKTVSGSGADQNGIFRFRVRVGKLNGRYGGVTFTDGTATVSVKAGSSVDIAGLPAGASYSVTELSSAGYTVTSRNATGAIPDNATVTASFNNEKQGSGDSGGKDDGGDTPSLNREEHYAYIIGYKDGLLRPNGNISRAEVATIFFRLLRDPVRAEYWNQTNPYPDVPADMWCNNAISTLTNMGIISGYSDGTFRPNDPITRAELTKIAAGFFADKRVTAHYDGRFSDVSGSEWFVSALEKAIEEGIVQGYQDGTFAPDQYITRAQACTIINRTLGRKPEADRLLPESQMLTWPDSDPSAWYYAQMQEATNSHDYIWVTGSSGKVEKWTKKLPDRDWAALEHIWSRADSSTGGEAMN